MTAFRDLLDMFWKLARKLHRAENSWSPHWLEERRDERKGAGRRACTLSEEGGMCRENRRGIGFVQHIIEHIIYVI